MLRLIRLSPSPISQLTRYSNTLEDTFELIVEDPSTGTKRFTLRADDFLPRSKYLAACHARWLSQDQRRPVVLKKENPRLFQKYLDCVLSGSNTVEQWEKTSDGSHGMDDWVSLEAEDAVLDELISLCLLAIRLEDYHTANAVIDEIVRFNRLSDYSERVNATKLAYESTRKGHPLRLLMRDWWIHEQCELKYDLLTCREYHPEFVQDVAVGSVHALNDLRRQDPGSTPTRHLRNIDSNISEDVCHYHVHDDLHPPCNELTIPWQSSKSIMSSSSNPCAPIADVGFQEKNITSGRIVAARHLDAG